MSRDITRLDYLAIANRFNLEPLKHGGDFRLDLTTRDGDIPIGNAIHDALHRLVVRWRFNAPTIKVLFDIVMDAAAKKNRLENEINEIATQVLRNPMAMERWHEIQDELGIEAFGPEACAGAIMVIVTAMLRREWKDLNTPTTWGSNPIFAGQSFGAVVESAANNFRHFDEWAATTDATVLQMKSMSILAPVLGLTLDPTGKRHPLRGNICPEILLVLSNGTFESLMDQFFRFARSIAGLK
jgi:phosphoribosylformylglycinamidine (FGAM) synthase PurS component